MLASHLLATFIKGQVKQRVDRTRPFVIHEEGRYEVGTQAPRDEGKYNSFPSGHTAGAVAVAEALIREYPDTASPARLWAGAIALIQVPRCSHYPSDSAAGALRRYKDGWSTPVAIAAPSGGDVVDVQARTAIVALLQALAGLSVINLD